MTNFAINPFKPAVQLEHARFAFQQGANKVSTGGNFAKEAFNFNASLNHPKVTSDFTSDQLLGAPVLGKKLDLLG